MLRELEKLLPHDIWPHWNRSFWFDVDSDGGPALVTADEIRAVICLHATRVGLRGDIEDGRHGTRILSFSQPITPPPLRTDNNFVGLPSKPALS